ncbi:hypothetical protein HYH03_001716 [Edaphochlamys debaryana]|uniref:Uncharacterized protein n=1 Tax=Edaphochlamys debaryana TaxID=47281 RepID=A0A835YLZ3_9CHLO|nr:hypothetical protein HYH03_001716 [Edaphochlamys debaryana]|eukprot:KAG2500134.1 hypothetical protein HYH03_001716 [Edaphochlamys debaryana]
MTLVQLWACSGADPRLFRLQLVPWADGLALQASPTLIRTLGLQPGAQLTLRRDPSGRVEAHVGPNALEPGSVIDTPSPSPAQPSPSQAEPARAPIWPPLAPTPRSRPRPSASAAAANALPPPPRGPAHGGLVTLYSRGSSNLYFTGPPAIRAAFRDELSQHPPGPVTIRAQVWAQGADVAPEQRCPHWVSVAQGRQTLRLTSVRSAVVSLALKHGDVAELWRTAEGQVHLTPLEGWRSDGSGVEAAAPLRGSPASAVQQPTDPADGGAVVGLAELSGSGDAPAAAQPEPPLLQAADGLPASAGAVPAQDSAAASAPPPGPASASDAQAEPTEPALRSDAPAASPAAGSAAAGAAEPAQAPPASSAAVDLTPPGAFLGYVEVYNKNRKLHLSGSDVLRRAFWPASAGTPELGGYEVSVLARPGGGTGTGLEAAAAADGSPHRQSVATLYFLNKGGCRLTGMVDLGAQLGGLRHKEWLALSRLQWGGVLATKAPHM